jgi:hypothetical protein
MTLKNGKPFEEIVHCAAQPRPTLYVLDPRGVIRYKWIGGPGDTAIEAALDMLMKEIAAP